MHFVFIMILLKIYALLIAFSRRRLSKSIEFLTKTNNMLMWIGSFTYVGLLINDTVIISLYYSKDDDREA